MSGVKMTDEECEKLLEQAAKEMSDKAMEEIASMYGFQQIRQTGEQKMSQWEIEALDRAKGAAIKNERENPALMAKLVSIEAKLDELLRRIPKEG
jgi:hypothetical protein